MTQPGDIRDTITRVSAALTESTLRYHFTGGIVSSHYGEPRLTADVDVVLVLPNYDAYVIDKLISYLSNDFIVDDESIRASLKEMNGFQVIDRRNYLKVDIHVGERIRGESQRAVQDALYSGVIVPIASREDCVISKLLWYSMGSERSWTDALHVVRRQSLNFELLHQLAEGLNLTRELDRIILESRQA